MIVWGENITFKQRLIPGFFASAALFMTIPFLTHMGGDSAYYSVFVVLIVFGLCNGTTQGTVFSLAAKFPGSEMAMVMLGNGVAGLGSNLLRGISLEVWPSNNNPNNLFYGALFNFSFAFVFLVLCGFIIIAMDKNDYAKYYLYDMEKK